MPFLGALLGAAICLWLLGPSVWSAAHFVWTEGRIPSWQTWAWLVLAVPASAAVGALLAHVVSIGRLVAPRRTIAGAPTAQRSMGRRFMVGLMALAWAASLLGYCAWLLRHHGLALLDARTTEAAYSLTSEVLVAVVVWCGVGAALARLVAGQFRHADLKMTDAERKHDE